jgi:hypothetical protein
MGITNKEHTETMTECHTLSSGSAFSCERCSAKNNKKENQKKKSVVFIQSQAIIWTLLNQVTGKSEAKQRIKIQLIINEIEISSRNLHMSTEMSGDFNHRKFFDAKWRISRHWAGKKNTGGQKSAAAKTSTW